MKKGEWVDIDLLFEEIAKREDRERRESAYFSRMMQNKDLTDYQTEVVEGDLNNGVKRSVRDVKGKWRDQK